MKIQYSMCKFKKNVNLLREFFLIFFLGGGARCHVPEWHTRYSLYHTNARTSPSQNLLLQVLLIHQSMIVLHNFPNLSARVLECMYM